MDENWSFWQRAATVPNREAAGRTDEGHSQNEAECPETREPQSWGFKVEIDI